MYVIRLSISLSLSLSLSLSIYIYIYIQRPELGALTIEASHIGHSGLLEGRKMSIFDTTSTENVYFDRTYPIWRGHILG